MSDGMPVLAEVVVAADRWRQRFEKCSEDNARLALMLAEKAARIEALEKENASLNSAMVHMARDATDGKLSPKDLVSLYRRTSSLEADVLFHRTNSEHCKAECTALRAQLRENNERR